MIMLNSVNMESIFYSRETNWNEQFHQYVAVSAALSEEQVQPSVKAVMDLFLVPVLTDNVVRHICQVAVDGQENDVEGMALDEARCAAANLALWYNFDELNTHLTDQGWKREEGDTYKSLYHYQEINLKQAYRNKGFNALDRLIRLLQSALHVFPEFKDAPAFLDREHALVKDASEVDKFFAINQSHLVFMALKPNIRLVCDGELEPLIGSRCYEHLETYLQTPEKEERKDYAVMEQLRRYASAYVICLALARQIEIVGSLTDRGMYFDSVSAGIRNSEKSTPLPNDERKRIAYSLRKDASRYKARLLSFIERELPDFFCGRPEEAYRRNNDNKPTFWA